MSSLDTHEAGKVWCRPGDTVIGGWRGVYRNVFLGSDTRYATLKEENLFIQTIAQSESTRSGRMTTKNLHQNHNLKERQQGSLRMERGGGRRRVLTIKAAKREDKIGSSLSK